MQPTLAFLHAHGPALVAFLLVVLPALATGLSRYPKASGVVTWLRVSFDVLSVVSHADSPGTFKAPFTRSTDPDAARQRIADATPPGSSRPTAPPMFALLPLLFACSIAHAAPPIAAQDPAVVQMQAKAIAAARSADAAAKRLMAAEAQQVAPVAVTVPAPVQPQPDKAKEAAAVIGGLSAGLQTGVQGVQALGKSNPAVQSWLDSKSGLIFMGCIGGAIVVLSAAGSFWLTYDTLKPSGGAAPMQAASGITVARW